MSNTINKYSKLMYRLQFKIENSVTPIKGFVVGLSGTDSIITYLLLAQLAKRMGGDTPAFNVHGIHYMGSDVVEDTFTKEHMSEWLSDVGGTADVVTMVNGNYDQYRWADLHWRAVNSYNADRYWVAGTVNATEKLLGTYSIMSKSSSIDPIASLYKSEVIELCEHFEVPQKIIKSSMVPDCICGRDEFAAENIRLIDDVIRNNLSQSYSQEQIRKAFDYISATKNDNGFKNRTPYIV